MSVYYYLSFYDKNGNPDAATAQKVHNWCNEKLADDYWYDQSMILEDNEIYSDGEYGSDVNFDAETKPFNWLEKACESCSAAKVDAVCTINMGECIRFEAEFANGKFSMKKEVHYLRHDNILYSVDNPYGPVLLGSEYTPFVLHVKKEDEEDKVGFFLMPNDRDMDVFEAIDYDEFRLVPIGIEGVVLRDASGNETNYWPEFDFNKTVEGTELENYELVSVGGISKYESDRFVEESKKTKAPKKISKAAPKKEKAEAAATKKTKVKATAAKTATAKKAKAAPKKVKAEAPKAKKAKVKATAAKTATAKKAKAAPKKVKTEAPKAKKAKVKATAAKTATAKKVKAAPKRTVKK